MQREHTSFDVWMFYVMHESVNAVNNSVIVSAISACLFDMQEHSHTEAGYMSEAFRTEIFNLTLWWVHICRASLYLQIDVTLWHVRICCCCGINSILEWRQLTELQIRSLWEPSAVLHEKNEALMSPTELRRNNNRRHLNTSQVKQMQQYDNWVSCSVWVC